ncbi:hypothetical protein VTK56DRAFT_7403 [Thermocarpiscus australiensis]
MLSPISTALSRVSTSTSPLTYQGQIRQYSQQQQKPPSHTAHFYRTFTRPVAKCALLAVFVYQLVYYGWTRLEHNEIKAQRQAEIARLEAQVREAQIAAAKTLAAASAGTGSGNSSGGGGEEDAKGTGGGWWRWK